MTLGNNHINSSIYMYIFNIVTSKWDYYVVANPSTKTHLKPNITSMHQYIILGESCRKAEYYYINIKDMANNNKLIWMEFPLDTIDLFVKRSIHYIGNDFIVSGIHDNIMIYYNAMISIDPQRIFKLIHGYITKYISLTKKDIPSDIVRLLVSFYGNNCGHKIIDSITGVSFNRDMCPIHDKSGFFLFGGIYPPMMVSLI